MALSNGHSIDNDPPGVIQERGPLSFLIIGAGSRGNAYATAISENPTINGYVGAIAEPIASKRHSFWRKYISGRTEPRPGDVFETWQQFLDYELDRRNREQKGESVLEGVDGVFVCVLDEMHAEIITTLAPLHLHIMSEKPLATTLQDCLRIYRSLKPPRDEQDRAIFSIGHVLRYSPHNMLLRKLLLEDEVIGDILSIEHTEPVGYWHFSHSYVRGNWRKESMGPSLLTKSCHDIDLLLWLLCSPLASLNNPPHLPSSVSSSGSLLYFKRSRKPALAGNATNCLSCAVEPECLYSAKRIYMQDHLAKGIAGWPVNIVAPEIEDLMGQGEKGTAMKMLEGKLARDYDASTPQSEIDGQRWFGRCVWEADNSVCDDQIVTMTWEEAPLPPTGSGGMESRIKGRGTKNATFHMVASTEKQCERRGRIYGTKGEIEYDSKTIRVYNFASKQAQTHRPYQPGGGHGGGDTGLVQQFVKACEAVCNQEMDVAEAQRVHIGCTLDDVIRSHAMVFAAEEARRERTVVNWAQWWAANIEETMESLGETS